MELLAPAGDWESLVAAVQNGADAVYLGAKRFGARQYAANFDLAALEKAVAYAHLRGVKVYVTVNTLIKDEEMKEALALLTDLYRLGVDAVIVQDLGLVSLAREILPGLPLHASTQMTIHNSAGVKAAAARGLKRVVLARELSLAELQAIRQETDLELEVFVHGALCICYSGQCLMSSLIGGRSGNRGRCAQPCRLEYELVDAQGKVVVEPAQIGRHLLSPRDLNLSRYLPALQEAGVDALKIEGRMKRPEYVATVVRVYRQALDRLAEGADVLLTEEMERDLWQIFNRGFTTGYLFGNPGRELMSYQRPNNRGVFLGRVQAYLPRERKMLLKLEGPLQEGDGVEVWVTRGGRLGLTVNRLSDPQGHSLVEAGAGQVVAVTVPQRVAPGDRVFKTCDRKLMEKAQASYRSPREERVIPLRAILWAEVGQPLRLVLEDHEGHRGEAVSDFLAEEAQRYPLDEVVLRQQLDRFGNTPFRLAELVVHLQGRVMVPFSQINEVRRRALADLMDQRVKAFLPPSDLVKEVKARVDQLSWPPQTFRPLWQGEGSGNLYRPLLAVSVSDAEGALAAMAAGANRLYLGGESFRSPGRKAVSSGEWAEKVLKEARRRGVEVVFHLPRLSHQEEWDRWRRLVPWREGDGLLVGNLGAWEEVRQLGRPIFLDHPLYTFNVAAAMAAERWGAVGVTASLELRREELSTLVAGSPLPVEVVVHGRLTLMVSAHCVVGAAYGGRTLEKACRGPCLQGEYGLRDRLGLVFPLAMDMNCRMHLFNPMELCLIDQLPGLLSLPVASLRIEAQHRSASYIQAVVKTYREALDQVVFLPPGLREKKLERMREELGVFSPQGLTRGHFLRGVE